MRTREIDIEMRPRLHHRFPTIKRVEAPLDGRDRVDRVDRLAHVTPVIVTFPAVSRTVSCTSRLAPSASAAWHESCCPGRTTSHPAFPQVTVAASDALAATNSSSDCRD